MNTQAYTRLGVIVMHPDFPIKDPSRLFSPSLLIFRDRVRKNLETMLTLACTPDRIRPHVKTHKMPALVKLTESMGIRKHKCATIAEAEMLALAGAQDVLLAYPVVGPNIYRLNQLIARYPHTTFRTLVDDADAARALSAGIAGAGKSLPMLIDLEVGMGRTGIAPGPTASDLYRLIEDLPNLVADGLHAYDGHLQLPDRASRRDAARVVQQQTLELRDRLLSRGSSVPRLVFGGTPTFPIHAELDEPGVECAPGTSTLFDAGYANKMPDLPFLPAAVLLTRVISRPRPGRLCLDLGHKAVAADPAGPRLTVLDIPEVTLGGQSEEHLVVDTPHAADFPVGTPVLAIPTHICPTCALHRRAYVMENGELVDEWEVAARDRVIGV
jgi:D-serine deaminase-like pyridoxal phosphate-dependent protein